MHRTKHIMSRMSQRGIRSGMALVVCAYGDEVGDRLQLGRKRASHFLLGCQADLVQLDGEIKALSAALDMPSPTGPSELMHKGRKLHEQKVALENEIKGLKAVIDRGGLVVVVKDGVMITTYGMH